MLQQVHVDAIVPVDRPSRGGEADRTASGPPSIGTISHCDITKVRVPTSSNRFARKVLFVVDLVRVGNKPEASSLTQASVLTNTKLTKTLNDRYDAGKCIVRWKCNSRS